jgi:hypothetical protein
VVGIQTSLRLNADVAKQRSEAVRIAQEAMETARDFSTIDAIGGYADISSVAAIDVLGYLTNTTFTLTQDVTTLNAPDLKELRVRVDWTDRNGQPQRVELNSIIGGTDPLVSRAIGAEPRGIPLRQPMGRHPGIPPQAKSIGVGELSAFKPPAPGGDVVWVFDNLTGVIVGVCTGVTTNQASLTAADIASCSDNVEGQPLSGVVRFSTDLVQPTAADAETPDSTALNLAIALQLTSTGHPTPSHECFAQAPTTSTLALSRTLVQYYCVIYSNSSGLWSGISTITPLGFSDLLPPDVPWTLASDAADVAADHFRVCRYTPATSDAQLIPNWQHPRDYTDVRALEPLADQNFLVIRAGDGTLPFTCPTDTPADPAAGDLINSNTLPHQPAPP